MTETIHKRSKILLIEDNAQYAGLIRQYLTGLVDEIILTESWEDAEQYLSEPNVHLVWVDLIIPPSTRVPEALEHIKRVRVMRPDIVIVVISGVTEEGLRERVKEAGADAYLHKLDASSENKVIALILLGLSRAMKRGVDIERVLERSVKFLDERIKPEIQQDAKRVKAV